MAIPNPAPLRGQEQTACARTEAEEKWSYRRLAAFLLVMTCGGFWFGVAGLVVHLT